MYRRGRSSVASSGTADMTAYRRDRSSVKEIDFELLKTMPENSSLYQHLGKDFLRRLVDGTATLCNPPAVLSHNTTRARPFS